MSFTTNEQIPMLTLEILESDIELLKNERLTHPVAKVRKRLDAIYWISQNYGYQEVAALCGYHRNTITNLIKLCNTEGIAGLKRFKYQGFTSVLMGHRLSITELFKKDPPMSCKQAVRMISDLTGEELSKEEVRKFMHKIGMKPRKCGHLPGKAVPEKQQIFIDQILNPLIQKAENQECHLFFMDAAHFVLSTFVGMVWCFARIFIKGNTGRFRVNVLGAIDIATKQVETIINIDYVRADTVEKLLRLMAKKYTQLPIYIVLDNARYQRCHYVQNIAKELGIQLVFLPPYSPNLNVIERLWKYIKKNVLALKYFEDKEIFLSTIKNAIKEINCNQRIKEELDTMITPKFQTFSQNL